MAKTGGTFTNQSYWLWSIKIRIFGSADKGNVVVAGVRSWPVENGQTAKLESGVFIACYSIDGTDSALLYYQMRHPPSALTP